MVLDEVLRLGAPEGGLPGFADGEAAFGAGDADFAGAAGFALGLPDIEAPQNGHSSTSSSKTEALQAGQVRKSMGAAQLKWYESDRNSVKRRGIPDDMWWSAKKGNAPRGMRWHGCHRARHAISEKSPSLIIGNDMVDRHHIARYDFGNDGGSPARFFRGRCRRAI